VSEFENLSGAVDGLYAAALGQIDWHTALDEAAAAMGCTRWSVYGAARQFWSTARPDYRLPVTGVWCRAYDRSAQRDYEAEYYKVYPHRHDYIQRPGARVCHDLLYLTEREMDRNPFHAWAEREHDVRYTVVGLTDPARQFGASLSVARPRSMGAMTRDEVGTFSRLLQHFERAVEVEYHMGQALAPGMQGIEFLEQNPIGVVLLDSLGRVVVANRAARVMAERADAFVLRGDGIAALRTKDDVALQRALGAAARTFAGDGLSNGGVLRLPRRTGQRSYAVSIAPLSRRESILSDLLPSMCVLITDPETAPSAALLRRAYGITAAEARLVERLVAGDTPQQAAQALGLAMPTVRNQLGRELIKLIPICDEL
jgi:PAS domain-containing protein